MRLLAFNFTAQFLVFHLVRIFSACSSDWFFPDFSLHSKWTQGSCYKEDYLCCFPSTGHCFHFQGSGEKKKKQMHRWINANWRECMIATVCSNFDLLILKFHGNSHFWSNSVQVWFSPATSFKPLRFDSGSDGVFCVSTSCTDIPLFVNRCRIYCLRHIQNIWNSFYGSDLKVEKHDYGYAMWVSGISSFTID